MTTLADIKTIDHNITNGNVKPLKALFTLVFGDETLRLSRKKLKEFKGFTFSENTPEYDEKCEETKTALSHVDLVSVCHVLDLDYTGTEDEVRKRIISFLCRIEAKLNEDEKDEDEKDEDEKDEDEKDEDKEDEDETSEERVSNRDEFNEDEKSEDNNFEIESVNSRRKYKPQLTKPAFSVTFKDVESSIRRFNGKDGYPVQKWLEDFEETATLVGWNELEKLIFAKKSLDGLAKLLVQAERGVTSWTKLKRLLRKEFEERVSSAEIHKLLMKRMKKKEETVQEYALIMREIASRANIEAEIVIQYIIDGIPDDEGKIILYGAKTFSEFKEKIKLYDTIKKRAIIETKSEKRSGSAKEKQKNSPRSTNQEEEKSTRCFGCGERGHKSKECPSKQKGVKCFRCNEFGHIASSCSIKKEAMSKEVKKQEAGVNNIISQRAANQVSVRIGNEDLLALVDTGAEVSVIREDAYISLGSPELMPGSIALTGIGQGKVQTQGSFSTPIWIDGDEYFILFHVIPTDCLKFEVVIGNNILSQADIQVTQSKILIKKKEEKNFLMEISTDEEANELIDLSHLDAKTKQRVEQLLSNYKAKKPKSCDVEMKIILKDDKPIHQAPRRLPFIERKEVEVQIRKWLDEEIIQPSTSEFASPVVVVRKKDKTARICIDYRQINKVIVRDRYPLPLIEDQLDQLQDAKVFSTIDLRNGFFHVKVAEDSRKYTSFVTHQGQYEFLKVPFGLCNSPAVFQRYINYIFRDLIQQGIVLPYMDDVIIPAKDVNEGLKNLQIFLEVASERGLEINWKKCQFLKTRVHFLGHIIENQKIFPSEEKTAAVRRFPKPSTVKQVQSFLGLTGYFRKFIPGYAKIAKPLSDLLKTNVPFKFGEEEEGAFQTLKTKLCNSPVLWIYHRGCKLELHTDASQEGFGAVLLQESLEDGKLHPIYYMSRKTSPVQQKYCSYELEVLAIIEALKKFRVYLLGCHFKLVTDCQAFEKTLNKKELAPRVARWVLLLEEFEFTVEHRAGTRLPHVDALSRYPVNIVTVDGILPRIRCAQGMDESITALKKLFEVQPSEEYVLKHDVLYKREKGNELLMVPKGMHNEIIRTAHEVGHFGVKKTEEIIKRDYYIPKIKEKIQCIIANCIPCILANKKAGKKEGFLHSLPIEDKPLETFHVDHLGPLPSTNKNYNHVLAIIDSFTKFVWLFPVKSTTAHETVTCLRKLQTTFGNPRRIISDRGTAYTAEEFKIYCDEEGIEHILTTTGVPRGNGQIERIHRTVIPVLTKLSLDDPTKWYRYVEKVQQILNSTFQRSTQKSPFELLTGVRMKNKDDLRLRQLVEEEGVQEFYDEREEMRKKSKQHLLKVQEENRRTYNLRRKKPTSYKMGDLVAIKRTQFGAGLKLQKKYFGPYEIIRVKSNERFDVRKMGHHDGPIATSTCAEYMKPWCPGDGDTDEEAEAASPQDDRVVGSVIIRSTPPPVGR